MKVLFVQNIAGIAGSEKYFLAIMPELLKRGIDCSFLAVYRSNEKKIAQEFRSEEHTSNSSHSDRSRMPSSA